MMGGAIEGQSLSWDACRDAAPATRLRAVEQILRIWHRQKHRSDPKPLWGEEIEYTLINLDGERRLATVLLEQQTVLHSWEDDGSKDAKQAVLQPEWATYMVEGVPAKPHGAESADLMNVEQLMRRRRQLISRRLGPNQAATTLCVFPRLGTEAPFSTPECTLASGGLRCPAFRYQILKENLMARKQRRAESHIPIFRDQNTRRPFRDHQIIFDPSTNHPMTMKDEFLRLDGMDMGMGSCSLQVTFQAPNETAARWLHDQLIPLGPVMLALTASAPVWKGQLVDLDSRWSRYSDCVDDRSYEEMDTTPPRWHSNQSYISKQRPNRVEDSSNLTPLDPEIKQRLVDGGMDQILATYYANIISRDPIMLTQDDMDSCSETGTSLIEKYQGAVWPTIRLKPPVEDDGPGWRVEFRPMEVQLCDSDNAAFSIFMYLLSRAIVEEQLDFYVPIDRVTESMTQAQKRNAVMEQRMWFRQKKSSQKLNEYDTSACALMTLDEIINGQVKADTSEFPGLLSIVRQFLQSHYNMSEDEHTALSAYLDRVSDRASGKNPTPAQWMRKFIAGHEDYKQDGHVSGEICYDMMKEIICQNGN